ncbi:MAG: tRNA (adenosine(37)-N6)-threonylcarbamoyltransferase complex transferase subunit TsaD [Verrucomicrobiae bacterium]|nr:tRNA (adenosine(37)-N6)-threonylcarbamoyltransferase complex transferase subunit TsaD [Verrucomicrobiae bacterium]MCX7721693.1 tRNA (adenosine(37)-N6)-threonylcarbamoyltransferase complex transferase subunit TsaD [Verrucomicrobiae bacterium]MDW7980949.1 tRNA (adenosine(37)-N6)-threonylcarbamoyltransferase complex transferase subunit TsaD [Verrucomicrobiales bacterium]
MTVLAIETSCDETSVAVVSNGEVRANVVSSQIKLHSEYGGVVPELAAREHLRNLMPVARAAMQQANVTAEEIDAVAATQGPGLPTALLVGLKAAQAVAFALAKPFVGIHHHEAHLYSAWLAGRPPRAQFDSFQPNVSLIASGGHTMLVHVRQLLDHKLLGATLDDAAGECLDKVGKMLGLPYPAGPLIERLAASGNPSAFNFPRPMLDEPSDNFSFSGLKTAVRYFLRDHPEVAGAEQLMRDLCASVQAAVMEVLVTKTIRAAKRLGVGCITGSGGVLCNSNLRERLATAAAAEGLTVRLAEKAFCTDNAGMVGVLAELKLSRGAQPTDLDAEIAPSMAL